MKKIEKLKYPNRLSLKKETVTRLNVDPISFNPGGNGPVERWKKQESDACASNNGEHYSCATWSGANATCAESQCVCQSCQAGGACPW